MKAQDEQELAAWLDAYLARKYARQLNPFFRGTVTAFTRQSTGTAPTQITTGYLVSVKRTGETAADGNQYAVLGDYVPVIGDVVECIWRDDASGWVLGPLIPQRSKLRATATWPAGAVVDTAGAWTKVPISNAVDNPSGIFRAATSDMLIPLTGVWICAGRCSDNGTAAGIISSIWNGGNELRRGVDLQRNAGGDTGGPAVAVEVLTAGSVITLQIWNRDAGNHNIVPSNNDFLSVQWLCGL